MLEEQYEINGAHKNQRLVFQYSFTKKNGSDIETP